MRRRPVAAALAAYLTLALLVGCRTNPAPAPGGGARTPAPTAFKVGMVTDVGGLGDKSFNDSAHAGLLRAQSELKSQISVVESRRQEDYIPNLTTLRDQGFDLTWAIGFLMADATARTARENPGTKLGIVDAEVPGVPNVASVVFREEEGSFLVGLLAAKASRTGRVGFVGGGDFALIWKFEAGFRAGVKAANPSARVDAVYTGVFDDPARGKEAALALNGRGADVIYHASGACGLGVIEAARERNFLAIGVDSDQNSLAPQNVLSSMLKRVDNAVFQVTQQTMQGKFPGGQTTRLGLKEGGVAVSPTTLWDRAPGGKELVARWTTAIVSGRVTVPSDRTAVATWTPPAI